MGLESDIFRRFESLHHISHQGHGLSIMYCAIGWLQGRNIIADGGKSMVLLLLLLKGRRFWDDESSMLHGGAWHIQGTISPMKGKSTSLWHVISALNFFCQNIARN
jgi:hypothetical protein